jgi:hypothetical protein
MDDGRARSILEKLRKENSQRLLAAAPLSAMRYGSREMLRDLRFGKFGHSTKRCATK